MSELALFGGNPVMAKPFPPYYTVSGEEKAAVDAIFENKELLSDFLGRGGAKFLGGKHVKELEKAFCDYFGVKHAVSFNSATTGLQAAVTALGIGPGDEVIVSPYTMSATASAILLNNAIPVFADVDETFCLDVDSVEKNITAKTKAIFVVDLMGGTPKFDKILELAKKHNLKIIEDCAQAMGANYNGKFAGTIGDIGVFSFNIHKVVQCGEGGVLITNNDKYALRAQLVRNHGEVVIDDMIRDGAEFEPLVGSNYRMSELHAAVALEQFKKLDVLNEERIALADHFTERLREFDWLIPSPALEESKHVYYIYPFRIKSSIGIKRKTFVEAMRAENFMLAEGYQKPLYLLPIYQQRRIFPGSQFPFDSSDVSYEKGICPFTEKMYEEEVMHTMMCQQPQTNADIDLFIDAVKKIERNIEELKAYERK
jgi:dTDP-4-amino-4,6-dideoxygalactose transaminase